MIEREMPLGDQVKEWALKFGELPDTIPVSIAETKYHKQWVLMRVTAYDLSRNPSHGYVLRHSPSRKNISKALEKLPRPSHNSVGMPYFVFHGYKPPENEKEMWALTAKRMTVFARIAREMVRQEAE